jgi:hypothetical protein
VLFKGRNPTIALEILFLNTRNADIWIPNLLVVIQLSPINTSLLAGQVVKFSSL